MESTSGYRPMDVAFTRISVSPGTAYVPCHGANRMGALVFDKRSATICSPRLTERFSTNTSEAPASASSVTMARAAPPAPRTTTRLFLGSTPASARTPRRKPLPSVFSPIRRFPSRLTVFTAPMMAASGAISSRYSMTATLCGIVRLMPCMPNARTPSIASRNFAGGTSTVRYRQFSPSAWKAASCMAPVGFSATGCPSRLRAPP